MHQESSRWKWRIQTSVKQFHRTYSGLTGLHGGTKLDRSEARVIALTTRSTPRHATPRVELLTITADESIPKQSPVITIYSFTKIRIYSRFIKCSHTASQSHSRTVCVVSKNTAADKRNLDLLITLLKYLSR